jgi:hypothetical protein
MKKFMIMFSVLYILVLCSIVRGSEYAVLRAEANENTTLIDLTTGGSDANRPATAISLPTDSIENIDTMYVSFCGGTAADKTFSWKIYAWRGSRGMCELVAYGTGTLGTQAVVKYPHNSATATSKFWADTLTITKDAWLSTTSAIDNGGDNRVAKLKFAANGFKYFYCEITSADNSSGTEAGNVTVYYAYTFVNWSGKGAWIY